MNGEYLNITGDRIYMATIIENNNLISFKAMSAEIGGCYFLICLS